MPNRSSKPKRPRDPNQLAKFIVDSAGEPAMRAGRDKNPAAVLLGRLGGQKGGEARAAALSPKKRAEIARKAAQARWKKHD